MGRSWARLGGENSRSKGFWGRRQANGCFRRCRGEGFCAGALVARQTAPGCTQCVWTEKGSTRTKRARAEAPRTGVYVISAWNVRWTGRTGYNRAQGSFFTDAVSDVGNIFPDGAGRIYRGRGHIRVSKQPNGRDMRIVGIGAVIGQADLIPSGERQWIVNHRIDLPMFNEIY